MLFWWIAFGLLANVFWIRRWIRTGHASTAIVVLASDMPAQSSGGEKVSVVMAAKDEAAVLGNSVQALVSQNYRNLEVVIANDRSRDRSSAILADLVDKSGGRLRTITITDLPSGWAGKPHAIDAAIPLTSGEWLCFTDADCRLSPTAISVAMNHMREVGADILSIIPELECQRLWEYVIQQVCALVLLGWAKPQHVSDPHSRAAYANGAFILIKRSCYEKLGGHRAVRKELNEDLRLAQLAKRAGYQLAVVQSRGLCSTRMYSSFSRMWQGWSRIFYGCSDSVAQLLRTAAFLGIIVTSPLVGTIVVLWVGQRGNHLAWAAACGLWGCATVIQHVVAWRLYSCIAAGAGAIGLVPGVLAVIAMLGKASFMKAGFSNIVWRETTYSERAAGRSAIDSPDA